jgi:hypothetical protein
VGAPQGQRDRVAGLVAQAFASRQHDIQHEGVQVTFEDGAQGLLAMVQHFDSEAIALERLADERNCLLSAPPGE